MQRVLIVDRDLDSRAVYRTILRHHGYEVLEAADGITALQMVRETTPDVMVTELTVPGKSGLDLLREVRSEVDRVCVIVLTAIALDSERDRAYEAGCQSVLVKPVEPRVLVNEIRRLLPG